MRSSILLILYLCTISYYSIGQSNLLNLGVEKFGLSIEEPFHTAFNLHQDSIGRLVAYTNENRNETLTYDGKKFIKKNILETSESMLLEIDNGGYWKLTNAFVATYVKGDYLTSIDVRDYLERNICKIYINKGFHYLLANDGYIKFKMIENVINIIEHHKYPVTRIENAYFIEDTIFINRRTSVAYILQSEPDKINYTSDSIITQGGHLSLNNGRILINTKSGLKVIKTGTPIYKYLKEHGSYLMSPYIDSKGRLWCNLRSEKQKGLFVFVPGNPKHIEIDIGIEKTNILNFYEDNLGDMWIRTSTQGIVHLFDQSIRLIDKSSGTRTDNISAIYQDNDTKNIYVSMNYLGLDILDSLGNKKIKNIRGIENQKSILVDQQKRMWIIAGGVLRLEKDKIIKHYTKKDGFHSSSVTSIFEDSNGDIWAGTRQVLHKYVDDKFIKFQIPILDVYDRIYGIAELENQNLLIAVDNGMYFIFDGEKFDQLQAQKMIPNSLFTDLDGTIWLATEESGLFFFEENEFKPVPINNHLQIPIRNLQDSNEGMLFGLCANNKVFYAQKTLLKNNDDSKLIKWLTIDNGLPLMDSERRRQPSTALLSTGEVVFPNTYGGIVINPKKILEDKASFQTIINYNGEIINQQNITLPYGYNDISLEICNVYLNPQASYLNQYKIDNYPWIDFSDNNLELRDLSKGNKKVSIRAKHINGEWLTPVHFYLDVPALFYEQLWFILGLPILIGLLIYLIIINRTQSIKRQNQKLEHRVNVQTHELIEEKKQLSQSLSKQKELTHELNLSQASKNRMYAQISHEFKSPLQAIQSHLSKKNVHITEDDKLRIRGNIDNLLDISTEIMELSKAESGNLKMNSNWYNINGVISEQIELKSQLAKEKNISIIHRAKNDNQYIEFDISLIQKVINNLLSNAIKFSPVNGQIIINSIVNGNNQLIEIKDQGKGIPDSEIKDIILAYYQASNNTEEGTGIGLSLVKEILKLHQTKLLITSKLEYGSTFGFKLKRPTITQSEIIANNINVIDLDKQLKKIIDPNKQVILAVDDSKDVLHFVRESLTPKYYVVTSENGEEAIEALTKFTPSAIISDFNMPLMNGVSLLKKIRVIPQFQALPFLFLTGSSSEETELLSIKAGADIFLQKPTKKNILISKLAQLLKRQEDISAQIKSSFAHDLLPKNILNDDLELMKQLEIIFLENIDNGKLKSHEIATIIGVGEKTLRNRIKSISGRTIKEYFKNFRLEKAKLLIDEGYGTMGEVASATGFSSLSYFSKSYKLYFKDKDKPSKK